MPPGSQAAAAATTEALHTKADQLRETRDEWVEGARGTMRSKATTQAKRQVKVAITEAASPPAPKAKPRSRR